MSRFIHIHVTDPEPPPQRLWVEVEGRCRCSDCGHMTESTWRWFESVTTWTHALCAPCVTEALKEDA